ncbi:sigma factor-like helix-turn-helix DNA-binding protein [Nocardioides sp.]|uniref:RNA polymerase sigma factor n=1 Tax=Nocardioides sp. TaxID=35761 RepID=UPI0026123FF2|nr:sigma factor-like helix-turn-helix DNA-binding protein [Nocardioides sp.]
MVQSRIETGPVRRRRRARVVVGGAVAAAVLGTTAVAAADLYSTHTGRGPVDAEDLRLGGPGERLDFGAPDFADRHRPISHQFGDEQKSAPRPGSALRTRASSTTWSSWARPSKESASDRWPDCWRATTPIADPSWSPKRERGLTSDLAAQPGPTRRPAADDPAADVVRAAIGRLKPSDRELLRLTSWEGLTPAEIAVALGVRPATARVRLHRARQALASDPDVRALVEAGDRAGLSTSRCD